MTISTPVSGRRFEPDDDDAAQRRSSRLMGAVLNHLPRLRQSNIWRVRVAGPQIPGLVSTTTVFAGVLLTLTPFLWAGSGDSSGWTAAGWNSVITGIAVTALGLVRLTQPLRLAAATGLGGLFGGWLVVAPLFVDFGVSSRSMLVTNVGILVGIAVVPITILGHFQARAAAEVSESTQHHGRR